jgi:hypothetical protein
MARSELSEEMRRHLGASETVLGRQEDAVARQEGSASAREEHQSDEFRDFLRELSMRATS